MWPPCLALPSEACGCQGTGAHVTGSLPGALGQLGVLSLGCPRRGSLACVTCEVGMKHQRRGCRRGHRTPLCTSLQTDRWPRAGRRGLSLQNIPIFPTKGHPLLWNGERPASWVPPSTSIP